MGEDWSSVSNSNTTVSEDRGRVDSVGEDGCSVDGVGEDRGSVDSVREDRGGVDSMGKDRGVNSVGNNRGGMGHSYGSRSVGGGARVANVLGDAITVVSIVDSLDPAVREVDSVAARGGISVPLLALGEGSSAVVVSNSVVVGIHWGLREVLSSVGGSSFHHQGGSVLGQGCGSSHYRGNKKDLRIRLWSTLASINMSFTCMFVC